MALGFAPGVVAGTRGADSDLWLRTALSLAQVDELEAPWRELDREAVYPLAHFGWIRPALAFFAGDASPHVIAAFRGPQLAALAPLVQRRVRGVNRLSLAGVASLFEPLDLVWRDAAALEQLIEFLVAARRPLWFERIPLDSPSVEALRRHFAGRALLRLEPDASCPYLALDASWKVPEQNLKSGRRSDLARARRKAEAEGPVRTEIHAPTPEQLETLLRTAFDVEERSWKGESGTALARDALRGEFYRQFAREACAARTLRICFLRIGEDVAAMQLALEHGGAFWLLKVGYDARFKGCSPGLLLLRETLRHAAEAGLSRYEFLGSAESWIEVWTRTQHEQVALRVYPLGLRGLAALAVDAGAALWNRCWRRARR